MISRIKAFFETNIAAEMTDGVSDHAVMLASAALLVEMSRADFEVDEREKAVIKKSLGAFFDLSEDESKDLLALAEIEADAKASLHEFVVLIDKQFSYEKKVGIIELLWKVAYADNDKDKYEEHLVRKVSDLLYIEHADFIRARHRVEAALGLS